MDDELHSLEAELKSLRPSLPSERLLAGLEQQVAATAPRSVVRPFRWWWATVFPAAAVIAVAIRLATPVPPERPAPTGDVAAAASGSLDRAAGEDSASVLKPVRAENVLVEASDEGLVTLADGTPARRERLQYVDTITWQNARTNASLTWRLPREEVRVVPINFQ